MSVNFFSLSTGDQEEVVVVVVVVCVCVCVWGGGGGGLWVASLLALLQHQ